MFLSFLLCLQLEHTERFAFELMWIILTRGAIFFLFHLNVYNFLNITVMLYKRQTIFYKTQVVKKNTLYIEFPQIQINSFKLPTSSFTYFQPFNILVQFTCLFELLRLLLQTWQFRRKEKVVNFGNGYSGMFLRRYKWEIYHTSSAVRFKNSIKFYLAV